MLHGTNKPDQIGQNVSRGCVRHHNEDIMRIFPMVRVGEPVYITNGLNKARIRQEDFGRRR
ncbi:MAG: L,D-transpeptidase family protein [Candidatus Obscuribacterales bacterium]|nr:L,D-transpeptidase family protein [Candidatus Obscuribacterales bacterium]